jgi:hypothetical protein
MSTREKRPNLTHSQRRLRAEKNLRRLGTRNPQCKNCDEKEPAALTGSHPDILCYEDRAKVAGRPIIEAHRFAGQHNDKTTIPILGNEHRILSDRQNDWPQETLRNPNGSPLRTASATLRGFLDILWLLIERILGWIPPFLEWLDEKLTALYGAQWWIALGLESKLP